MVPIWLWVVAGVLAVLDNRLAVAPDATIPPDDANKSPDPIDEPPAVPVASDPDASIVPAHDPPNPES